MKITSPSTSCASSLPILNGEFTARTPWSGPAGRRSRGDDLGQRGLAQSRRTEEQHVAGLLTRTFAARSRIASWTRISSWPIISTTDPGRWVSVGVGSGSVCSASGTACGRSVTLMPTRPARAWRSNLVGHGSSRRPGAGRSRPPRRARSVVRSSGQSLARPGRARADCRRGSRSHRGPRTRNAGGCAMRIVVCDAQVTTLPPAA